MTPRGAIGFAGGLALALALPFLAAQVGPVGGLPSKPRFTSVGIGKVAPSATGALNALANINSSLTHLIDNDSNGTANLARQAISSGDANLAVFVTGSGRTSTAITNGPTGAQAGLRTLGAHPIIFGTNNTLAATIDSAQVVDFVNAPTLAGAPLVSTPLVAIKTADESVTSSITLQNDDALTLTFPDGPASTFYAVMFFVNWNTNGSTANGIRMNQTAGGGGVVRGEHCTTTTNTSATAVAPVGQTANSDLVHTPAAGGTSMQIAICECTVEADASGSTITLQWAQATSNATSTRVSIGSNVRAIRLN